MGNTSSERTSIELTSTPSHAEVLLKSEDGLNILDSSTLERFHEVLDRIVADESVKVVTLLSSSPKAFTAGADIAEMESKSPAEAKEFSELGQSLVRRIERDLPPVLAVLRGYVMGGGVEIACGCDIRIASVRCTFSQPEIDIGVIPGWGGTQRLSRLVGLGRASEMILLGKRIDAQEAFEMGLVNHVVEDDMLEDLAFSIAGRLSEMSRDSLINAKKAIRSSVESAYEAGFDVEREAWSSLFGAPDQKEGMRAFLERRKPRFTV